MNNKLSKKINIDYILKNYFYLIILIFIPLVLIFIFLFFIFPNYKILKTNLNTAINLENEYSKIKIENIKKLREYKKNISLIDKNELEKIKKILPYNKDIEVIINEINQISKKINVSIEKISFLEDNSSTNNEKEKGIKEINFSINIKDGKDYRAFKDFLLELESNIRLFNVKNFYITKDFNKYSFDIVCYYKEI